LLGREKVKIGAVFVKCVIFNTSCVANFPSDDGAIEGSDDKEAEGPDDRAVEGSDDGAAVRTIEDVTRWASIIHNLISIKLGIIHVYPYVDRIHHQAVHASCRY
jgi:hypothetical protein